MDNHRRFLAFLELRLGDRDAAEDVLQQAFVKGIGHADTVRDEESVVAWFFRILRNAVTDRHRQQAAAARLHEELAHRLESEPDEELEREACACLAALLPTLDPGYAELLERIDLGGQTVPDLAKERGVTEGSLRVRLHRARAALRRALERTCRTCAEHGCLDCTCGSTRGDVAPKMEKPRGEV